MWDILIVEDNEADTQVLVDGLKGRAECTVVKTGDEALQTYSDTRRDKKSFDFILLDVDIPDKNGFEVLKTIRQMEEKSAKESSKETPIIMITTYKDSLMENYNMGWDDFITKPVDISILINRLAQMKSENKSVQ